MTDNIMLTPGNLRRVHHIAFNVVDVLLKCYICIKYRSIMVLLAVLLVEESIFMIPMDL
jgi:hypothetical protein